MKSSFGSLLVLPLVVQANTWGKPMRFNADGTFKLTEVSDTHYTQNLFCKDIRLVFRKLCERLTPARRLD